MAETEHPLPVKYARERTNTNNIGQTIYEYPGQGLYRVTETPIDHGLFKVETLSPFGWITLIEFTEDDGITSAAEAMSRWIDIQSTTKEDQD